MNNTHLKLSLFALAASCFTASLAQPLPPLSPDSQRAFAFPQKLVDIGGRRLNLHCSGSGPVTVVLDAYGTGAASSWFAVQPHIARRTRACVFDRAGLGFSDPSPRPSTSGNSVDDLHQLLGAAGIAPPYVMVGSSFGGANAQLFAYRYPTEVAGLVLVEPMHEDDEKRMHAVTEGKITMMRNMEQQLRAACTAESAKGFVAGSEMWANCVGGVPEGRGIQLGTTEIAMRTRPEYWAANNAEVASFTASAAELGAARKPFGDLPLIVLSRSISPYAIPGQPQSALNKAMEDENQRLMQSVAGLSTRGSLRRIAGAGHIVHERKPAAVVRAIEDILENVVR